jgi:hypothetical protein
MRWCPLVMTARREIGAAARAGDANAARDGGGRLDEVSRALGARGSACRSEGRPDLHRHLRGLAMTLTAARRERTPQARPASWTKARPHGLSRRSAWC